MLGQKKRALKHLGQVSCGNLFLKEVLSNKYKIKIDEQHSKKPSSFAYPSNIKDINAIIFPSPKKEKSLFARMTEKSYTLLQKT
jgi:hypothetical protein